MQLLMDTLNFTAEDLEANRRGMLSDRQRWRLQRYQARNLILSLIYASLPVLVDIGGILLLLATNDQYSEPSHTTWKVIVILIIVLAFAVSPFIIAVILPSMRYALYALTEDTVVSVDGFVGVEPMDWLSYRVSVQDNFGHTVELVLKQPTGTAFKKGRHYRVYYTQNLKRVLSAEMISAE